MKLKIKLNIWNLKMGRKIKKKELKYETRKHIHDFQQYETVRYFGEIIYTCKLTIVGAEEDQSNLLKL